MKKRITLIIFVMLFLFPLSLYGVDVEWTIEYQMVQPDGTKENIYQMLPRGGWEGNRPFPHLIGGWNCKVSTWRYPNFKFSSLTIYCNTELDSGDVIYSNRIFECNEDSKEIRVGVMLSSRNKEGEQTSNSSFRVYCNGIRNHN